MSIVQALIGSVSGQGGGGPPPPPPPPTTYPVTLAMTGASMEFLSGGYWQTTSGLSDFEVGTGDYTIEWWQWMLDSTGAFTRPFAMGTYPNTILGMSFEGSAYFWANGSPILPFAYTRENLYNTWTHIAVTRTSGTTIVFFNGVEMARTSASYNIATSTTFSVGNETSPSTGSSFVGYMKDFRFIKGLSLYPDAFTPPVAPLGATIDTKLLLSVNDTATGFSDSSTSAHTYNASLNIVEGVGPYDLAIKVTAAVGPSYNPNVDPTTWYDLSPAGNNIILTNTLWLNNGEGGVISFGSNGSGISVSNSIASGQQGMSPRGTISFWASVTNTGGYQHLAGFRVNDKMYVLNLGNGTNFECRVEGQNGSGYWDNYPNVGARFNTMTHYAFSVNGTRSDFYINGVLASTTEGINTIFGATAGNFSIGQVLGSFQSNGLVMGELQYYNRARSPKEILAEFNATRSRYGV